MRNKHLIFSPSQFLEQVPEILRLLTFAFNPENFEKFLEMYVSCLTEALSFRKNL